MVVRCVRVSVSYAGGATEIGERRDPINSYSTRHAAYRGPAWCFVVFPLWLVLACFAYGAFVCTSYLVGVDELLVEGHVLFFGKDGVVRFQAVLGQDGVRHLSRYV